MTYANFIAGKLGTIASAGNESGKFPEIIKFEFGARKEEAA